MAHNSTEKQEAAYRSAFRGYIWLSAPLPFLFHCASYLTSNLKTICRLIIVALLMLDLFVMYHRYDAIRFSMKKKGTIATKSSAQSWMIWLGLFVLTIVVIGQLIDPNLSLSIKGLIASGYHVILMLCWYQRIREPKE